MKEILQSLKMQFGPESVARFLGETIPKFIGAALVLTLFFVIWKVLERSLNVLARRIKLDPTLFSFIQSASRAVILVLGFLTAAKQLGFDITSILTSLGVAGLTVGFAARDALSNIISGIFIFWDRPFVLGDLIELNGQYGTVEKITLRSTRVVTPDGKMLAIPNSEVINSTVASYTNFPHLRLDIHVTVAVREELGRLRAIFLEMVRDDPRFLLEPAPVMVVEALNDYNIALQFQVWVDDEKRHIPLRYELRERIFETFRAAGVDMPYETLKIEPLEIMHRATT